jgi:hypothetical protein
MKVGSRENKYNLNEDVYLKTDIQQLKRMVTGIRFISGGSILYDITLGEESSCHHEAEISNERDVLLATSR